MGVLLMLIPMDRQQLADPVEYGRDVGGHTTRLVLEGKHYELFSEIHALPSHAEIDFNLGGEPVREMVAAGELAGAMKEFMPRTFDENLAALAYISILPADWPVALFWC
jgi:hypothetical protein